MNPGVDKIDLRDVRFTTEILRLIPAATARSYSVIPIADAIDGVVIAAPYPFTVETMDDLRRILGRETIGYESQKFVAISGGEYTLARKRDPSMASPFTFAPHPATRNAWVIFDHRDRVAIEQKQGEGPRRVVSEACRVDYVFEVASSEEAIAAYHRKNP